MATSHQPNTPRMTTARYARLALLLALCLGALACYGEAPTITKTGSLRVALVKGTQTIGPKGEPLPVPTSPKEFKLEVTPLDSDGKPDTSYDGQVCVYTNRGLLLDALKPFPIKGGKTTTITVRLKLAFGKTTLWAAEASPSGKTVDKCPNSQDPTDITRPYVGRAGAAADIFFANLSIRDFQASTISPYDSPLYKKYAYITGKNLVVTAVTSNGFYVTDLDALADKRGFDSMFVFTFSAPTLALADEEVPRSLEIGEMISKVEGGIDEFSGHTQITFPSFTPDWANEEKTVVRKLPADKMPAARPINLADTWSRGKMEPLESALVEVKNAIAVPFDQNQDGWSQFRQWPVLLVKAKKASDQQKCEDLVRTELYLHVDPKKNTNSSYRSCLSTCHQILVDQQKDCKKDDEECLSTATDAWFNCFFGTCRFDRENGLFARFDKAGCEHSILLVITNTTIPGYDPTTKEHLTRVFPSIKGILIQSRASGFYKLHDQQYDNEQSNNGYVIWVRGPDDLKIP